MARRQTQYNMPPLNESTVIKGALLGALVGGLIRLWRLPRSGTITRALMGNTGRDLRYKLDPASAANDSIAQGKAYARQNFDYDPDVK
jgi:hypothetical protein